MEGSLKVSKSRPWLICVLCCLIFLFSNGAVSSSFSTTLMYIRDEFALSEAQASMVTSMRSLTASFCLAILLFGYNKLSVKAVIIVALGAAVAGFLVFAYAASYTMLLVGSLLLGICYGFAGVGVITPIVRSWFVKHRALALGLVTASTGFANVIFPQIIRLLVNGASLRVNFIVTAIMFAVIAVVAIIFLKDDPIKAGYYPLGGETLTETASDGGAKKEYVESSEYAPDWRCHALMFVFIFCVSGFNYSAWSNFTLLFTGAGWARDTVTYFMSICGFLLMVTKSGYGAISDKFSVRKSGWVFFLACFIAMVMCGLFSGVQNLAVMGVIFVIYCIGGIFSGEADVAAAHVPDVAVIEHADGDALGGVDGGAAADGHHVVHALAASQLYALADEAYPGIGHYAAQLYVLKSRVLQAFADGIQHARAVQVFAGAVVHHNLGGSVSLYQRAQLFGSAVAEHNLCVPPELKIMYHVRYLHCAYSASRAPAGRPFDIKITHLRASI